jgi:hypothetical protein
LHKQWWEAKTATAPHTVYVFTIQYNTITFIYVFRIYYPLTLNGYSNFINAVKRQRNLGLGEQVRDVIVRGVDGRTNSGMP